MPSLQRLANSRSSGVAAAPVSRRQFLADSSTGFGMLALAGLMADRAYAGLRQPTGNAPVAKHVIFCFMDGGPSHVDTFDPKPELSRRQGQAIGDAAVSKLSQSSAARVWLGSPWKFRQRGQSGLWVSDLFPEVAKVADDLCVLRSLVGKQPLHGQQALLLHTGRETGRAPSIGSWVNYGLGTENQSLPGYVLLNNDWIPNGGYENFASAFLPATTAATLLRPAGTPVDNIVPSDGRQLQRHKLNLLRRQDTAFAGASSNAAAIESAIGNYETAFAMQDAIPALADVSRETAATRRMYGLDEGSQYKQLYSLQCLRARRLVEAGVRFVEITCPLTHANNSPWDQHGNLHKYHTENAHITDQAVAALITDLKQRGLLEQTIVIWAGEMGRTPHTPKVTATCGRDHHVNGYSIFMCGGGFRGGMTYGQTDDFGNQVIADPLTIHDVHATVLHQLGLDHETLTYRFGGRDVSLTDVHGKIIHPTLRS